MDDDPGQAGKYYGDLYDSTALDFEPDEPFYTADAPNNQERTEGEEQREPEENLPSAAHGPETQAASAAATEHCSDSDSNTLEQQLKESRASYSKLLLNVQEMAAALGRPLAPDKASDANQLVALAKGLRAAEAKFQEELRASRKREAQLQLQVSERTLEATELRRELSRSLQAFEPAFVQMKQLVLDPAVNKEFQRLKQELEDERKEVKRLQEELEAVTFTQDSKTGRLLMNKCKSLQEENEEMGKELAEGRFHKLEATLELSKAQVKDLHAVVGELQEHCAALDEENDELQTQVFALRRQMRDLDNQPGHFHMDRRPDAGPVFDRKMPGRGLDRKRPGPGPDKDWQPRFPGRKRLR